MAIGINNNIMALYQAQTTAQSKLRDNGVCPSNCTNNTNETTLTKNQKRGIGLFSTIGLCGAIMLLAKFDKSKKYTVNPLKILKGNIKDSYLATKDFKAKEIVTMGAGSILGGLIGGEVFGKKENLNSRIKEGIVQLTNIAVPIGIVQVLSEGGNKIASSLMPNWSKSKNILKQAVTKLPGTIGAMSGLIGGMYIGNKLSNKTNEKLFHTKENRPMKFKDFSAHVDDIGVAATFIAPENILTKTISRLIPFALFVPGYETGTKCDDK